MQIYVEHNNQSFIDLIGKSNKLSKRVEGSDLVVFTGGSDVSPILYNERKHNSTMSNPTRDLECVNIFLEARRLDIPMLGICRGSQFLTVINGGKLLQHVSNHAISGTHEIELNDGSIIDITSTHHQMMFPYNLPESEYELVGWSKKKLSNFYFNSPYGQQNMDKYKEPEIVYYKKSNALAIQGHPEFMLDRPDVVNKIRELISKYLCLEVKFKKEEEAIPTL